MGAFSRFVCTHMGCLHLWVGPPTIQLLNIAHMLCPCGMPCAMPPVACLTLCPLWHALRYAPCGMPYAMPPVACLTLCPLWHALRYAPCGMPYAMPPVSSFVSEPHI